MATYSQTPDRVEGYNPALAVEAAKTAQDKAPEKSVLQRYQALGGTLDERFVNKIVEENKNGLMSREFSKPVLAQAEGYVRAWKENLTGAQEKLAEKIYASFRSQNPKPKLRKFDWGGEEFGPEAPRLPDFDQKIMAEAVKLAQAIEVKEEKTESEASRPN